MSGPPFEESAFQMMLRMPLARSVKKVQAATATSPRGSARGCAVVILASEEATPLALGATERKGGHQRGGRKDRGQHKLRTLKPKPRRVEHSELGSPNNEHNSDDGSFAAVGWLCEDRPEQEATDKTYHCTQKEHGDAPFLGATSIALWLGSRPGVAVP